MSKRPKDSAEVGAAGGPAAMQTLRDNIVANAIKTGVEDKADEAGPPPDRWPADVECEFNEAAEAKMAATSGDQAQAADDFAPFVQLDLRAELPTFPLEALPRWAADWAAEAAESLQVPTDMAAGSAVGAMAIACAGKARVDMFGGEPLNLYMALIDRSGANKSGIVDRALRPVDDWEASLIGDFNRRMDEWTAKVHEAGANITRIKAAIGRARKGDDATQRELDEGNDRQRLEEAVKALREIEEAMPRADIKRAADITPEAMADHLASARTVAQVSAEGAEVFDTMVRYQGAGAGAGKMEEVLKAWKGERLIKARRNGTKLDVASPTLTIIAAAQPDVLEKLRDPDGSREGRGLLGRFLYVVPVSKVGYRRLVWDKATVAAESAYRDGLRSLLDLRYPIEGAPPLIQVGHAARALASDFYDETEAGLRPGGEFVDVESFTSKMRSHLARFAGLLHLGDGRSVDEAIDGPTMRRALDLARYCMAHGRAAFGMMTTNEQAARALKLWPVVLRLDEAKGQAIGGHRVIEQRDLRARVTRAQFPDADSITAALVTLEAHGYVRRVEVVIDGRKAKRIAINPGAR